MLSFTELSVPRKDKQEVGTTTACQKKAAHPLQASLHVSRGATFVHDVIRTKQYDTVISATTNISDAKLFMHTSSEN
jgi:hypothetical protein